jgi:predicted aspartyl protease
LAALLSGLLFSYAPALGATTALVPDAATIRANVKAAAGQPLANETRVTSFTANGLQGTEVYRSSGEDWRVTTRHGPFEYASGEVHGQRWRQNENGETIYDMPAAGKAAPDPTTSSVHRISTPLDAFVISTLNLRGNGTKDYVDPLTWHIVRRDFVVGTGTTTCLYDDFRSTAGNVEAWHWTCRDGQPTDDREYRIVSEDPGPLDPQTLADPPSRRNLVEFPAGKTSVMLPVRLADNQFIVRVNVGGRGLDFILDSGSSAISMDEDVARQLGLPLYAPESNSANAGSYIAETTIVPQMRVGELTMHDVVVATMPHFDVNVPGQFKVVGLLGFDFIGSLLLKLDYRNQTVTGYSGDSAFAPPADAMASILDVRLGDGTPKTDVAIGGALGEQFLVDTGAATSVIFFDYFTRRHHEALVHPTETDVGFRGVGGDFDAEAYNLPDVLLGNIHFKNVAGFAVTTKTAYLGGDQDGVIGAGFLSLFDVYLDYEDSKIYLVPSPNTRRLMRTTRAGG